MTPVNKERVQTGVLYLILILLGALMLSSCAVMQLKPEDRALVSGDKAMDMWKEWKCEAESLLADDDVPLEEKQFIVTEVSPKLNELHGIIVKYNEIVIENQEKGTAKSTSKYYSDMIKLIGEIEKLFFKTESKK